MVNFSELILRKFRNIAGSRYEEIMKAYQEFFLTEEELQIPTINSILFAIDRFSGKIPDEVFDVVSAYPGAKVEVVYLIDSVLCGLIRETLGEDEARKFREKEEALGREILKKIESTLSELGMNFTMAIIFDDKVEFIENETESRDLLVISRHFGSESVKTHKVSPVVFRIVQGIKKPVIVY
ncbi:universal stress protein [Thermococcus sp.]|uniref:universal stress protein n=1 Tax=Thermococcus sp. TaxID=35749 RepID=UPI0026288312|nr:universal stress protein [Thermococcus sp.]